jgi:RNA polymerase-binding transcription factor DksA
MLPQLITIFGFKISTLIPFALAGVIAFSYLIWSQGKKDGFDEEHLFDLALLCTLISLCIIKIPLVIVVPVLFAVVYVCATIWKWSVFRVTDIVSLAIVAAVTIPLAGYILIHQKYILIPAVFLLLAAYVVLSKLRSSHLLSGYVFSLILLTISIAGPFIYRDKLYLLFYGVLAIISLANIYFRRSKSLRKKDSMAKNILPLNVFNELKNRLLSKRKQLKNQQKIFIQEDPYLQSDRASDNSELMDEALLEDTQKEYSDIRKNAVDKMQIQVRKALARMRIGKYGTCEVCGKTIEKARLEAYPQATTCLEHAPNA